MAEVRFVVPFFPINATPVGCFNKKRSMNLTALWGLYRAFDTYGSVNLRADEKKLPFGVMMRGSDCEERLG